MKCPVMVQLIKKLDSVRAEQCNTRGDVDDAGKRRTLRAIEKILELHQQACTTCKQTNSFSAMSKKER